MHHFWQKINDQLFGRSVNKQYVLLSVRGRATRITTVQDAIMKLHRNVVEIKVKAESADGCGLIPQCRVLVL